MATTWLAAMRNDCEIHHMTLIDLLQFSVSSTRNRRREFFSQVTRSVGLALDAKLVNAASTDVEIPGLRVSLYHLEDDVRMQQYCAQYWQAAGKRLTENPLFVTCAPDKARVGSLGLMVCPVTVPGNYAFWAVPQDFHGICKCL